MHFASSLMAAAFVGVSLAQTPAGFTPQAKNTLDLVFNSTAVTSSGKTLAKAAVATQPKIATQSTLLNSNSTYMFVMLDIDLPPTGSNTTRGVLLHCMNTGFKASTQKINGTDTLLTSPTTGPATYISPSPPATDTIPHRYVQMLFQQPANFNVQGLNFSSTTSRTGFNIVTFMSQHGLAAPVAGNYFLVDGRANATATTTGGGSRSSVVPFTGAAGKKDIGLRLAAMLCALVLLSV